MTKVRSKSRRQRTKPSPDARARGKPAKPNRKRPASIFDRARSSIAHKVRATPKRPSGKRKRHRSPQKISCHIIRPMLAKKRRARKVRRARKQRFIRIFSEGKTLNIRVSHKTAVYVGGYLNAVGGFLDTNDVSHLKPYGRKSVSDVRGNVHVLETRPNVLYRLNAAIEPFEEVYRLVA